MTPLPENCFVIESESESHHRIGTHIAVVVLCSSTAVALHCVIRWYYPPDIDRSKWLAATGLLVVRNAFVGAAIGAIVNRPWFGFVAGLVVPPVAVVMTYGMPG